MTGRAVLKRVHSQYWYGIPDLVQIREEVPKMVQNRSGIGYRGLNSFWDAPVTTTKAKVKPLD